MTRYVYFIRNPKTKEIKIGETDNIGRRKSELERSERTKLEILHVEESVPLEKVLHGRFSHLSTRGEWFSESSELYVYMKNKAAVDPVNKITENDTYPAPFYFLLFSVVLFVLSLLVSGLLSYVGIPLREFLLVKSYISPEVIPLLGSIYSFTQSTFLVMIPASFVFILIFGAAVLVIIMPDSVED